MPRNSAGTFAPGASSWNDATAGDVIDPVVWNALLDDLTSALNIGTTGATDNRLIRSDGTGGLTFQSSAASLDDSGNLTGVTISSALSTFLQAGTGAETRTVQEKLRETLTPLDFMDVDVAAKVIARTATSSDAPAITAGLQEAVNRCVATGTALHVPSGTYLLDAQITASAPISIFGDGMMMSRLQWITTATTSGLAITSGASWFTSQVSNLAIETFKVASGTALSFDYSGNISGGVIVPRAASHAQISSVWVRGATAFTTDGWLNGIAFVSCQGCSIENSRLNGVYTGAFGSTPNSEKAVSFTGSGSPVQLAVNSILASAWQVGLFVDDAEGVYVTNCEFTTVSKGIQLDHAAGEPVLHFLGTHINAIDKCAELINCTEFVFNSCSLYALSTVSGDFIGIHVKSGCANGVITGCTFARSGASALYRGIVEDGGTNSKISGNDFAVGSSSGCIGIDITVNAVNCDVGHNVFSNANVRIANASTTATFAQFNGYTGDLDAIVTSNRRSEQLHTLGSGTTNPPSGASNPLGACLKTLSFDANSAIQLLWYQEQNRQYQRRKTGGAWQGWETLDYENPTFDTVEISSSTPTLTFTDTDTGANSVVSGSSGAGSLLLSADFNNEVANSLINFQIDGSAVIGLSPTALRPSANDGAALGTSSERWSDAYYALGAVLNFNGDAVVTHSAGVLSVSTGDLRVSTAGTNTASVVTVGGTQTLTAKTLTSPTIAASPTAAGATWTDLGTVTTADINGGTVDGTVIGGASAAAGTFTTLTANTSILPGSDGAVDLGSTTAAFNNLHLDTGATINVENGNAVVTHSSGIFTVSTGDWRVTTAGTNAASTVTVGGTQTLTAKTLTSPTIGTSPTAAGATWTDLGAVTTVDINGGTVDGVTIGGASAGAITGTTITATGQILADDSTSTAAPVYAFSDDTSTGIGHPAANTISFSKGGAEVMRIDSGSRLLIGATASVASLAFGNQGKMQLHSTSGVPFHLGHWEATATGGAMLITKSRNGTVGSHTVVQSGDTVGQITFEASDGDQFVRCAEMRCQVDGTPGDNDMPGRLMFSTTADGSASVTERMRITSTGAVYVNDTADTDTTIGLTINQGAADNKILTFKSSDIAHGVTSLAETDTYGYAMKASATGGGLQVVGIAENATIIGLHFIGVGDTSTTKSTAGTGMVTLDGQENDGDTIPATNATADSNLLAVRDNTTTRFILDSDGDSHQDVGTAWTNFDHLDDVATLNALAYNVARPADPIKQKFGVWMAEKREVLEAQKIVRFNDDGHHFVNMSKLAMLHTGAIRQLGARLDEKEARIARLEARLAAIATKH
jgi:hypothetical protein